MWWQVLSSRRCFIGIFSFVLCFTPQNPNPFLPREKGTRWRNWFCWEGTSHRWTPKESENHLKQTQIIPVIRSLRDVCVCVCPVSKGIEILGSWKQSDTWGDSGSWLYPSRPQKGHPRLQCENLHGVYKVQLYLYIILYTWTLQGVPFGGF